MSTIFISHSSRDQDYAQAITDCLRRAMVDLPEDAILCTTLSGQGLLPGMRVDDELRNKIEQCAVVVGLISENSIFSGYVVMELGAAWGLQKMTCPVVFSNMDSNRLPGPLARTHAARANDADDIVALVGVIADRCKRRLCSEEEVAAAAADFVEKVGGALPPRNAPPLSDELAPKLLDFLNKWPNDWFNAARIRQWGALQSGYDLFLGYSSHDLKSRLEQLSDRRRVRTKPGQFGPLFKKL